MKRDFHAAMRRIDHYENDPKAAAIPGPGKELIAGHGHQTIGRQFIELGLVPAAGK